MYKAGVKNIPSTNIEIRYNKIQRMNGLDDLARILFPINKLHKKVFLAIFIELKYAPDQFLPSLLPLCVKYGFTLRTLETVRSKMRRMGIIDHVCRFNKTHGYREGWVFSNRFYRALISLSKTTEDLKHKRDDLQKRKDYDLFSYL
jgi:hypothetical protein